MTNPNLKSVIFKTKSVIFKTKSVLFNTFSAIIDLTKNDKRNVKVSNYDIKGEILWLLS